MTSPLEIVFLTAAVFVCSMITAVTGAGGGVLLLALMLQLVPPAVAIPAHGLVQLATNVTRTWLFRNALAWPVIWRYGLLLPFGATLGILVFQGLPEDVVKILIGLFVLLTLVSGHIKGLANFKMPLWIFLPTGFITGALNMIVGAMGPVLAVLAIRYGLTKEAVVGTLGAFGIFGNVSKIVGFSFVGFSFASYWPLFLTMIPAGMLGMYAGRRLLWRFSEQTFRRLLQAVLIVMALKLILYDGLGSLWRA
jgi:uncharacterized protein